MTIMRITITKKGARIGIAALVVLLGLAYPAVTFAATGTPTPPSTINTCTKVNPKTHLYGKTKVSTTSTCAAGQYAQTWEPQAAGGTYNLNETINVGTSGLAHFTGKLTFPAGTTVSFVPGSANINANLAVCDAGIGNITLGVEGPPTTAVAGWGGSSLVGTALAPGFNTTVTLGASSAVSLYVACGNGGGAGSAFQVSISLNFTAITPTGVPYT